MKKHLFKKILLFVATFFLIKESSAICVTTYDTVNVSLCSGSKYYTLGGVYVSTAGTLHDTLFSVGFCDSIIVTNITINSNPHPTRTIDTILPCPGGRFVYGTKTYNRSGTFIDTIKNNSGCDSFITINLTITPGFGINTNLNQQICTGDSFNFFGTWYKTAGVHRHTITGGSVSGCDSTINLNLAIGTTFNTTTNATFCLGGSYSWRGHTYTAASPGGGPGGGGGYRDTVHSTTPGCDSIFILRLTTGGNPTIAVLDTTGCLGDVYTYRGKTYTYPSPTGGGPFGNPGYHDTILVSGGGCDTIINITLRVKSGTSIVVRDSSCAGSTYLYNGHSYTVPSPGGGPGGGGFYRDTIKGSNGNCDTIVRLYLTVKTQPLVVTVSDSLNLLKATNSEAGPATYVWKYSANGSVGTTVIPSNGATCVATATGVYTVQVTKGGCVASANYSVFTIYIGINAIQNDPSIKLYPNPNNGSFLLEAANYIGKEMVISDMLGQVVERRVINNSTEIFQLKEAAAGSYQLVIKSNSSSRPIRFVINK